MDNFLTKREAILTEAGYYSLIHGINLAIVSPVSMISSTIMMCLFLIDYLSPSKILTSPVLEVPSYEEI
jgi:hypothetical protein